MIEECISANIGASLNGDNMSVIAYADDIVLLSPSLNHLKRLVKVCNEYGNRWFIKFNGKKSTMLQTVNKLYDNHELNVKINDSDLAVVSNIKYLGCEINSNNNYNENASKNFANVRAAFDSLLSIFSV